MFDPKQLLETFLGNQQQPARQHPAGQQSTRGGLTGAADLLGGIDRQKTGSFAAGAATGGLLGLLLGSKKVRKVGGGLLGYGGAAVLGGLAYKAWQNYQMKQDRPAFSADSGLPGPAAVPPAPTESGFDPSQGTATDGRPFALALIRAMIAAVKSDGHIDAKEQSLLQARIEAMALDAEAKAFVFDELARPTDLNVLAALPRGPEQAAELWLVSRLVCDPDDPHEQAHLSSLAAKLKLPTDLLAQLEKSAAGTASPVAVLRAV
jgi:uncharacterized membrane protein YebE (DUF533 family)